MNKMKQLSMTVSSNIKDLFSDFLIGLDASSVSESELDDEKHLIRALYRDNIKFDLIIEKILNYSAFLKQNNEDNYVSEIALEDVDEKSFDEWKRVLKAVRISKNIVIKPPWENYSQMSHEIVVDINPSMAFGTGHHETTKLCIQLIEDILDNSKKFSLLDAGCGSGILSIVASKLGISNILAFDIDKIAVLETKSNVKKNNVKNVDFFCGRIESIRSKYDIVVANISVDTLISMKDSFKKLIYEDGVLILSGIPLERSLEIKESYTNFGFSEVKEKIEGEWVAFEFKPI